MLKNVKTSYIEYDDIQEVVPVKAEPRDAPYTLPLAPSTKPGYHPDLSRSNMLAPVDDQPMAYPDDTYDDYAQYDDQGYQGGEAQHNPTEGKH